MPEFREDSCMILYFLNRFQMYVCMVPEGAMQE